MCILEFWPQDVTSKLVILVFQQWGSVIHKMEVPVQSISSWDLKHHNLFFQIQNALAFNWDTCCHLTLSLPLLRFHRSHVFSVLCSSLALIMLIYFNRIEPMSKFHQRLFKPFYFSLVSLNLFIKAELF